MFPFNFEFTYTQKYKQTIKNYNYFAIFTRAFQNKTFYATRTKRARRAIVYCGIFRAQAHTNMRTHKHLFAHKYTQKIRVDLTKSLPILFSFQK